MYSIYTVLHYVQYLYSTALCTVFIQYCTMYSIYTVLHYVQYLYYVLFTEKGALVNLENGVQLLLTLNEHNCFITLICLKHFSKPRKDRFIFLLNVYFGKIKTFQLFFVSDFSDDAMRTFYKLPLTMYDNVILLHD